MPCINLQPDGEVRRFSALARDLGAERLATGHYVRRIDGPDGAELHRAADPARDQSWFLFATTRQQLDMCLFPLGGMANKRAVRDVAQRLGLGVAEKPDSQDICFVPSGSYADVVAGPVLMRSSPARSSPPRARRRQPRRDRAVTRWARASGWVTPRCWTGSARSCVATDPDAARRVIARDRHPPGQAA